MGKVIGIIAIVLVGYYWAHTQRLKSVALLAGSRRCKEAGVQLLDHTVVMNKLRFGKDTRGRWRLLREYLFDFTSTGEQRYQGKILLQGAQVASIELQAYTIN